MAIEIHIAASRKEMELFCSFPNVLYKGNPYYVPTLEADDFKTFDRKQNAAFEFCQAEYFLAYKDGKLVGRCAAIINPRANEAWKCRKVRFGWIDFIDDTEVSAALLKSVEKWGKERGMEEIEGPLGFTDFDTEGMLVEGFEEEGTLITFYNHEYYKHHLEALGYRKCTDWLERRITIPEKLDEKYLKLARIVAERNKIHVVRYTRKEIKRMDIGQKLFDLVNRTYCKLYGYSILSKKQIDQYVKLYLSLVDLRYVSFVNDENDNLVAFGVMLPSMNEALHKSGGRYLPFGWWHLLKALYFSKADTIEMLLIAVEPSLQSKGVPAMLITDLFSRVVEGGFKYAETNPELEDNYAVANLWNGFDLRQHRRRRVYGKAIEL